MADKNYIPGRVRLQRFTLSLCKWHSAETVCSASTLLFTALHEMQTRSSDENSVCPSVCPSHVDCDKMEEKSVQIFILCERSFRL